MLTILETTSAIETLPTEKDIIRQACLKYLNLDKIKDMGSEELAKHLIFFYSGQVKSYDLLVALAGAAGVLVAIVAKPSHEEEVLHGITQLIRKECYELLAFHKRLKRAPPEVITALRGVARKVVEDKYGPLTKE